MGEKINPVKIRIIGIDEAGRGPLCGPVVAASCFFKNDFEKKDFWTKIKDSKKYSQKKREDICRKIKESGKIEWGVGIVDEKEIDRVNILEATKIAMKKAVEKINYKNSLLIIDGVFTIDVSCRQKAVVKADEKVLECSIASIIAKVERDGLMEKYHQEYPLYGFNKNKGYGTKKHREAIKKHGPCPIHRNSFRLV